MVRKTTSTVLCSLSAAFLLGLQGCAHQTASTPAPAASASATPEHRPEAEAARAPASSRAGKPDAGARLGDAVASPLSDLNLVGDKLPEVLLQARREPYVKPADASCAGLAAALGLLDEQLGPDLDTAQVQAERDLMERGGEALGDAAIGTIKGAAEGLLPFRGWLRRLSGADKRDRDILTALRAGVARRGYLRGLQQAQACPLPPAVNPAAANPASTPVIKPAN